MPTRGELCFSRWLLNHKEESGGLFSRLVWILTYALFLGVVTLGHKALLLYVYYRFMERYDEEPIPLVYLDGIASYIGPAYCILMFVVLCFILCACCGVVRKARELIHWTVALLIGATVLSILSYTAQIILYTIRVVLLFMDHKVVLVAVCYCASMSNGTHSVPQTTLQTVTSMSTHIDYVTTNQPNSSWEAGNFMDDPDVYVDNTAIIVAPEKPEKAGENKAISDSYSETLTAPSIYWCLCDVPSEDFPIGVTTNDPNGIDADYLAAFGVDDYDDDVITHVVNTTQEVKENADTSFTDEKLFLTILQGITLIITLRVPFWIVLNNIWSHVDRLDHLKKWNLANRAHTGGIKQPRQTGAIRLWELVKRADAYINYGRPNVTPDINGWTDGHGREESSMGYQDGVLDGIKKGYSLQKPPATVGPALFLLFCCLLALVDTFCLLDEFLYRRHHFREHMTFTYVTLATVSITMVTTMVMNMLTIFPSTKTCHKAYLTTRFVCVVFTTVPYLVLRIWLFVVYNCFADNQLQSSFFVFIIAEMVVLLLSTVDYGMEMKRSKRHQKSHKSVESLEKWRNYSRGIRPESGSSRLSVTPQGHVNVGAYIGESTDGFTSDDETSSNDDVFYTKSGNDYVDIEHIHISRGEGATSSVIPTPNKPNNRDPVEHTKLFCIKPVSSPEDDQYTASLYNNPRYEAYGREPPIYSKPFKVKYGENEYKPQNTSKDQPASSSNNQDDTRVWYHNNTAEAPQKTATDYRSPDDRNELDSSGGFGTFKKKKQSTNDIINEVVRDFKPKYSEDELNNMVFYI